MPPASPALCRRLFLSCIALLAACGGGGGGGGGGGSTPAPEEPRSTLTLSLPRGGFTAADLALIVATGDPLSEAVAAHYQTARGIPAANIIRVSVPTGSHSISSSAFATLKAEIDGKLPAGVQATLLTWNAPSRVAGPICSMSITSAMAFGYDDKYCNRSLTASCLSTAASAYFDSESAKPRTDHALLPSMMLGASTLAAAQAITQRGLAADATLPPGEGWLIRTTDANRNIRSTDFQGLPTLWSGRLALNYVDSAGSSTDSISGKSNVLFYFTGLSSVPNLAANSYRPGAVGDSLTSFAGRMGEHGGQMPVTAWLDAGLTASYGTVEEPCNHTQKFPQASVLIDQYWRGATLIEAYWKSVAWPGQGLFVGEPLAQPFRDTPSFTIDGNDYLISTRALRRGGRYALEYRTTSTGSWINITTFTIASTPQIQSLRAARPPATAVQLRWTGPCPSNVTQQCTLASSS